jgi:filamentous hemagglutinin
MYSKGGKYSVDFASEALSFQHYAKHSRGVVLVKKGQAVAKPGGADMPEFGSHGEYRNAAQEFMPRPSGDGFLEGIRPKDGAIVRFDPSTGYFGAMPNGIIRTFFRPDFAAQMNYFNSQF